MNIDKLSDRELNKVSLMLTKEVDWDKNLNPINSNLNFDYCKDSDSIDSPYIWKLRRYFWNPLENDEDLLQILRNENISIVKDYETSSWDIGQMVFFGHGEYRFTDGVKYEVKEENLSKEIVKFYIKTKLQAK